MYYFRFLYDVKIKEVYFMLPLQSIVPKLLLGAALMGAPQALTPQKAVAGPAETNCTEKFSPGGDGFWQCDSGKFRECKKNTGADTWTCSQPVGSSGTASTPSQLAPKGKPHGKGIRSYIAALLGRNA
jgi:hypothetical protein